MNTNQQIKASVLLTQKIKEGKNPTEIIQNAIQAFYDNGLTAEDLYRCLASLKALLKRPVDEWFVDTISYIKDLQAKRKKAIWTTLAKVFVRALALIFPELSPVVNVIDIDAAYNALVSGKEAA